MSAVDYIREDIRFRADRIAEAKRSIGNLTHHIALLKTQVATYESELITLRADLKRLDPIKAVSL